MLAGVLELRARQERRLTASCRQPRTTEDVVFVQCWFVDCHGHVGGGRGWGKRTIKKSVFRLSCGQQNYTEAAEVVGVRTKGSVVGGGSNVTLGWDGGRLGVAGGSQCICVGQLNRIRNKFDAFRACE